MGSPSGPVDARERLSTLGQDIRDAYEKNRRALTFDEYFSLVTKDPARHVRSSAHYLVDLFDHYGVDELELPRGKVKRWKLFDCPFDGGRDRLLGQEDIQARVYRTLSNFRREGRVSRLLLLHGPNGSAKSTFVSCVARALEHYSTLEEGALYRFNWIFPSEKMLGGAIGFGGPGGAQIPRGESFAHLLDEQIDAKLVDELRDHPLLLIPAPRRRALLSELLATPEDKLPLGEYLLFGELSPRNRLVYEALLSKYRGDYARVLNHVQVERFYVQRRYREAMVTVEPQLHVDARARQITMDRSLSSLPSALQSVALHEYQGELVDANRGMIEYADLLKRPLEAYKYLLGTVEQGRVSVEGSILYLDVVFIGSSNESHLSVFKEIPEFQSFKGRMELVRVPYLLDYTVEEKIYAERLRKESLGKHVAPHATWVIALWSVLTRMRKPLPEKYPKALGDLVGRLGPLEKAELYARGVAPDSFTTEQARDLTAGIERIWGESDAYPNYEGRTGASPREVQNMLMNAGANPKFPCLSPLAIFEELEELVKNVTVYEFLKQEPLPGGYHENKKFIYVVRDRYLDEVDDEVRSSMGLVEEAEYVRHFERYVTHVNHWTRKEKVRNVHTGRLDDPDEEMMKNVEATLGITAKQSEFRSDVIARIGAWSLDNPKAKPSYPQIFPKHFERLREAYYQQHKKDVGKTCEDLLVALTDGTEKLPTKEQRERATKTLGNLTTRFGYCENCAKEAVSLLLRKRYAS